MNTRVSTATAVRVATAIRLNDGTMLVGTINCGMSGQLSKVLNSENAFVEFVSREGQQRFISRHQIASVEPIENVRAPALPHVLDGAIEPYGILGLRQGTAYEAAKNAFQKLSEMFSLDRWTGDDIPPEFTLYASEKLKQINTAFTLLRGSHEAEQNRQSIENSRQRPGGGGGAMFGAQAARPSAAPGRLEAALIQERAYAAVPPAAARETKADEAAEAAWAGRPRHEPAPAQPAPAPASTTARPVAQTPAPAPQYTTAAPAPQPAAMEAAAPQSASAVPDLAPATPDRTTVASPPHLDDAREEDLGRAAFAAMADDVPQAQEQQSSRPAPSARDNGATARLHAETAQHDDRIEDWTRETRAETVAPDPAPVPAVESERPAEMRVPEDEDARSQWRDETRERLAALAALHRAEESAAEPVDPEPESYEPADTFDEPEWEESDGQGAPGERRLFSSAG